MSVPYASARSHMAAREEVNRILRRYGCSQIGWMDQYDKKSVLLGFTHRGRNIQISASGKGWAVMYLRENPWNHRRRSKKEDYERHALEQGLIAVNSIIRDWVKGMVTAIECGIFEFDTIFLPYMLTKDGRTIAQVCLDPNYDLLPPPEEGE